MIVIEQFDMESGTTKRREIAIEDACELFTHHDWFRYFHTHGDWLMSTVADLKTSIDALTAAVTKVAADVAALKAAPPPAQNVDQADLDAAVAGVNDATSALRTI